MTESENTEKFDKKTLEQCSVQGQVSYTDQQIASVHVQPIMPLNGKIEIVDYNPEWPALFAYEAQRVRAALREQVLLLEHVGSTSVPGLPAKPRIDMLLVVPDSAKEQAYVPQLEAASYVLHVREPE